MLDVLRKGLWCTRTWTSCTCAATTAITTKATTTETCLPFLTRRRRQCKFLYFLLELIFFISFLFISPFFFPICLSRVYLSISFFFYNRIIRDAVHNRVYYFYKAARNENSRLKLPDKERRRRKKKKVDIFLRRWGVTGRENGWCVMCLSVVMEEEEEKSPKWGI
jgi:hypothetical protein